MRLCIRYRLAAPLVLASVGAAPLAAQTPALSAYEQLQTFSGVLNHVRVNYVDSVEFGGLVRSAIRGMLRSLDPHSYYVSRQDFELRAAYDRGLLAGVGLSLEDADGASTVLAVEPDGPAARGGVLAGDRIRALGDSVVAGVGSRDLEVRLLGDKGTKVRVTFDRGARLEPDTFSVTLKRQIIEHHVVSPPRMVDATTGYVRLAQFTPLAPTELADAIGKLTGSGAKQLILDLRNNPGGEVSAMVAIASLFLDARTPVFRTQGRKRTGLDVVNTTSAGPYARLPLVLLVNEGSASASEMLAGSLQDHDRALVIGRMTFGKALMQSALALPNGDVVWLTIARVVTPSGRVIQRRYSGLAYEQYEALAGKGGAAVDTAAVFHTDHGRTVRGGGGIRPDVERPVADFPAWFSVAADSGWLTAIADSVAATLAADKASLAVWSAAPERWDAQLLTPLVARARSRLAIQGEPAPDVRRRVSRYLASRAIATRWGSPAAEEFLLHSDEDVRLAIAQFPKLASLLVAR